MKPKHKHRLRLSIGKGEDGIYHYKSFTGYGDTPAKARKEAERLAREWQVLHQDEQGSGMTLRQAYAAYISSKENALSPFTVRGYIQMEKTSFQGLMELPIDKLDDVRVQQAVNDAAKTHSPKTVRNAYG